LEEINKRKEDLKRKREEQQRKINEDAQKQRRDLEEDERRVKEEAMLRKQEVLRAQEEKKQIIEMQEQLARIREDANRRIQSDRNDLLSRIELENQLKQQNNNVRKTKLPPQKIPQRLAPKLADRIGEIRRPDNNNAPRYLNSPNNKKVPRAILENAQYDNQQADLNVFEAETDLDREVLNVYSNRNVIVEKNSSFCILTKRT